MLFRNGSDRGELADAGAGVQNVDPAVASAAGV
jgi:hypothetical protein